MHLCIWIKSEYTDSLGQKKYIMVKFNEFSNLHFGDEIIYLKRATETHNKNISK